jgi:hypothetical protein
MAVMSSRVHTGIKGCLAGIKGDNLSLFMSDEFGLTGPKCAFIFAGQAKKRNMLDYKSKRLNRFQINNGGFA